MLKNLDNPNVMISCVYHAVIELISNSLVPLSKALKGSTYKGECASVYYMYR